MKGLWWWWDDAVDSARAFAKRTSVRHKVQQDPKTGLWAVSEVGA